MATVKKFRLPPKYFSWFEGTDFELNHSLNITDNTFEYKLTRTKFEGEEFDRVIYDFKLDLDVLKNHSRFCDQSYWTFNANRFISDQQVLENVDLMSIFDLSFPQKRQRLILETDYQYLAPVRIFVPSVNAKFTDCLFTVLDPKDISISDGGLPISDNPWNIVVNTSVNPPNTFVDEIVTTITSVIASITSSTDVASPTVGDQIPVTVTCSDSSVSKLYLEPVVGLLDRTEVVMTAGSGSFNVLTDGLSSGDTVRIKIGHKKYSSVNIFTKQLA